MGKKTPTPQVINQTTTNIPDYAAPYFNTLLNRAQAESNRAYIPYGYTQDPTTGAVVRATEATLDAQGNPTYRTVSSPSGGGEADWNSYLASNPDVAEAAKASGMDPVAFAQQHYRDYGQGENRALGYRQQIFNPVNAERIAGFTADQKATQANVMGLQTPSQFGAASGALQSGLGALARTGEYTPGQFEATSVNADNINSKDITAPTLQQYQMRGPQEFGQAQAQQYMSPYIQNVLNTQKREAVTDAQKGQLATDLNASRLGTYGGARQLLAATERERALGQQLGDIEYRGLQSGYENAQAQFERDRAAQLGVGTTNLNALLGVQQQGAGLQMQGNLANQQSGLQAAQANQQAGLQAALANQQAQLEAQRMAEASKQFGANLNLQGAQAYGQLGQTYTNAGQAQQQAGLQMLNAQNAVGAQQQAQNQQGLDMSYGDFQRQQQYPLEQLNYMGNILRGVPIASNTTSTTSAPAANPWAQAAGAGLTALSYSKLI